MTSSGLPAAESGDAVAAERPQVRTSETRRATKPIMEKRRRARINQCLTELKVLILDALNKDPSRHSKLEKADILEMTVRHLQNIQRQHMVAAISTDPVVMTKFKAGFTECANEVSRYIMRMENVEPSLRQRLVNHLAQCVNGLASPFPGNPAGPFSSPFPGPMLISPLSVQIPGGDINNNSDGVSATSASANKVLGSLPLIPSRLPNGDLAFVLPTLASAASMPSNWGPPTPTSTATPTSPNPPRSPPRSPPFVRRTPSPVSSVDSALSPVGSCSGSDIGVDGEATSSSRSYDAFQPQQRHPQPDDFRFQLGERDDSVWRPW